MIPFAQDDYSVYFGSELFIDSFTKTQFYNLPIDYSNLFSTSPDSAYFGKIAWTNTNTVFTKTIITQLVFIYKGDQSTFPENIPITLIINEQYYSINLKCCTQSKGYGSGETTGLGNQIYQWKGEQNTVLQMTAFSKNDEKATVILSVASFEYSVGS